MVGGGGLGVGNELEEEDGGLVDGVLLDIFSSFWAVSPTGFNFEREARIPEPREEGGFSSTVPLEVEEEEGRAGELVAERESADA